MKWVISKLRDKNGSAALLETTYVLPFMFAVVIVILSAIFWAMSFFKVWVVCDKVVRSIEVSGLVDEETYNLVDELIGDKLDVEVDISANYYDSAEGKIQLRDTFTVTLTSSYDITIYTPMSGAAPIVLKMPIQTIMKGMSEVFWR